MNSLLYRGFLCTIFLVPTILCANSGDIVPSPSLEKIISNWYSEMSDVRNQYEKSAKPLIDQLSKEQEKVLYSIDPKEQLSALLQKERLKEQLQVLREVTAVNIHKIKYIKGLQIIKLLYEKSLSLDHHFASVATFNDINKISNPNSYPEFLAIKDLVNSRKTQRNGFDITGILGENIYTSLIYSFVSLFNNKEANRDQKDAAIAEVECILDFSLQMHNELNTIYFETKFLKKSNQNITSQLEELFIDFTKPIAYEQSLKDCRQQDNWDEVRKHLSRYLDEMREIVKDDSKSILSQKMQIDLEFPVDRLLQFIIQYNAFIDQGSQFYEKFAIMLDSYQNNDHCSSKIPPEYNQLRENIQISIEKFNTAYKPVEINGSKMKEILYGLTEYD